MIGIERTAMTNSSGVRFLDGIAVKAAITSAFLSEGDIDTSNVRISVPANYVAVEGHVDCPAHRQRVVEIAQLVAGRAIVLDSLVCR